MVAMLVRSKDGLGLRRLATYDMTTCFAVHQTEPMEKNRWDTLSFDLPYETHQVIDLFGDTGCGDDDFLQNEPRMIVTMMIMIIWLWYIMTDWWFGTRILWLSNILGIVTATDFHIFQRGGYTTNQLDLFGDTGCCDESLSGYFMIQVITYTFAGFLKWWYP